nr:protein-disulfide reductase DsbD domain-containing protein [uncultured Cohaesibacter sp.]
MKLYKNIGKFAASLTLLCLLASSLWVQSVRAAVSPWHETEGGRMRLVSAGTQDGRLKAGLEIELDEGWKTYWKVPGDAGLPPSFNLSASTNAADIETLWPVPHRIKAGSTEILGYKDAIIFPFLITPQNRNKPVTLDLAAQVGLCAELCVPLYAELSLEIPANGSHDMGTELLIDRDMALVPTAPRRAFGITDIEYAKADSAGEGALESLVISANIPDGYGNKDLFVEAPEGWFLPLTRHLEKGSDNQERFLLRLEGLPKGVKSEGAELTFTLTNGDEAVVEKRILKK